jgi:surfeit locus 1 family protein
LYLKNYHFNFKVVPTLAFIIAFSCFIRLGFWQLDRADKKNILNDNYTSRQQDKLISLNKLDNINHKEALLWRKVELNGSFLNEQNIILDNQIFNQTAGFNIITPFKISNSNYVVLINRGWHSNLESRELIPNISSISGNLEVTGHISKFPVSGINLGQDNIETLNASIFRLQRLDSEELSYFLTFNLLPYMIYLDPLQDREYLSNFKLPAPDSEKNYGYAFQWFAFAFTLLIIFLRLGIQRK